MIARIKGLGGQAIHLEPIGHAGFPDLLVTKEDKYVLVELKSIRDISNAKFDSIFEQGQLSWYCKQLMDTDRPVVTLVEVRARQVVILYYFATPGEALMAYSMTLREVFDDFGADTEENIIRNVLRFM